ncbi:MAG: energy transducer TonB [Alteraurantiacibacter sp.]
MIRFVFAIATVATASLGFAGAAIGKPVNPEPTTLAPVMNWNVDFAEDSCALRRMFGEEGQRVYLELRQYEPGNPLVAMVASNDFDRLNRPRDFSFSFAPDAEFQEVDFPMGIDSDDLGKGAMFYTSLMTAEQRALSGELRSGHSIPLAIEDKVRDTREAAITHVTVNGLFEEPIVLETGSIHPAMGVMRQCMDELVEHWGVDVEAHRTLLRTVQPLEMNSWVRRVQQYYPRSALMRGQQAYVRIRLNVSEEGRATDCAIQASFNEAVFDEAACRQLLRYSRFEPALDANGDPIASYWHTAVRYQVS